MTVLGLERKQGATRNPNTGIQFPTPTPPPQGYLLPSRPAAASGQQDPTMTQNALAIMQGLLGQWDLTSLMPLVQQYIQQGYTDANAIDVLLQQTNEWKTRFAGNELRKKAGLAVLDPATYLSIEAGYKTVINTYGLPQTFDDRSYFAQLIGKNIAPQELDQRAQGAYAAIHRSDTDPTYRKVLQDYYGMSTGQIMAAFLEPSKAEADIQRMQNLAGIGAAAARQGFSITKDQAGQLSDIGKSPAEAENAFSQAAAIFPEEQKLGQISGTPYTQQDAVDEFGLGLASAQRKRRMLNQQEQARFAGSGGADTRALRGSQPGSY